MYIELFNYTTQKDLQGEVSEWGAMQVEFNGKKTARFILCNNKEEDELYAINLDKKHVAVELKREDAIEMARGILFALEQ